MARKFTRSKISDYIDDDFRSDVEIVVSELVTNAYEAIKRSPMPRAPIRLGVQRAPRWVHAWVIDTVQKPLKRRNASTVDEHGRGLQIVDDLSSVWWVHEQPEGKTVHAILTVPNEILSQDDLDRIASGL